MSFGFLSGELLADTEHRLLRLKGYDGALVFPASALVSFRFLEDGKTLFEGKADGLHCHESDVPERARAMQMRVDRFQMQKEEYERMERMERMRDRDRRPGEPDDRRFDIPEPRFEADAPVHKFSVEVILNDPYWKSFRNEISAPSFMWGDRIFEKCGIGRDEGGDGGKTLEIRGKRRLSARDGGANYQQS